MDSSIGHFSRDPSGNLNAAFFSSVGVVLSNRLPDLLPPAAHLDFFSCSPLPTTKHFPG